MARARGLDAERFGGTERNLERLDGRRAICEQQDCHQPHGPVPPWKRRVPGGEKPTRMHGDPLQGGGVTLQCDVFILPGVRALWLEDRRLSVRDTPTPEPPPGEALVRVVRAGICNTDIELTTATAIRRGRTPRSARRPPASPPTRRSPRLRRRSEERRVGKSVDLGGRRIIKKKK